MEEGCLLIDRLLIGLKDGGISRKHDVRDLCRILVNLWQYWLVNYYGFLLLTWRDAHAEAWLL